MAGNLAWFSRVGGKHWSRKRIVAEFPPHEEIECYVEPFVGSGKVLLTMEKYPLEIVNDKDRNVFHLWKDMQTISSQEIEEMDFTPSRERFNTLKSISFLSERERLERNLYINLWSYGRNMGNYAVPKGHYLDFKRKLLRKLPLIQERIKDTIVLNTEWREVIEKYDDHNVFFYLDPPYHETLPYPGLDPIDPQEIYNCLSKTKARWALSYNDHPLIREMFSQYKIIDLPVRGALQPTVNRTMDDILILNYD